jgi:hypothetical protein
MRAIPLWILATLGAATMATLSCREKTAAPPPKAASSDWNVPAKPTPESPPPPYRYPAPVKGHFREVNTGEFDLVDGIACPARSGGGTVVYVTSKPSASPVLAASPCPMTQARALTQLREAGWSEVTLDGAGRSGYFAAGKAFGGSSRETEVGGHYWSSKLTVKNGRASGNVRHRQRGEYTFDLPLSEAKGYQMTEAEWTDSKRDASGPRLGEEAVRRTYKALHDAAARKDLKAFLAAQGFDAKQVEGIRGLEGIDADFAAYTDRFLDPGTAGDFTSRPGTAYVRSEGTDSKGKKFANYYHFAPCGESLVLVRIAVNPQ